MHAATINDLSLSMAEHIDPTPGSGELLVRVKAAGINGADLLQLRGLYPAPQGSPQNIPGLEFAGEVTALGADSTRFKVGDRVMGILGGGGQAELTTVHERQVMPVPDGIDWAAAGGFAEVFTTAYDALFSQAQLASGERVLIHGGAGGVGTAAIQLAVATGAQVTATVRNSALHAEVSALGATVIDPENFQEHGPFDVVLELVGAPNMPTNIKALATGGRIVVIGIGAGQKAEVSLGLLMSKRGSIHGSTLRARPLEQKAAVARLVESHVLPLLASGKVTVPVAETFPLTDAEAAYKRFSEGGKFGKIVLLS